MIQVVDIQLAMQTHELEQRLLTPRIELSPVSPSQPAPDQQLDEASQRRLEMAAQVSGIDIVDLPDVELIEKVATR